MHILPTYLLPPHQSFNIACTYSVSMPRYQERVRLDRLSEIQARIMKEISQGLTINLSAIQFWIHMNYGVHSKTSREYLEVLEGSGLFEIDWEARLIRPLEQEEEEEVE